MPTEKVSKERMKSITESFPSRPFRKRSLEKTRKSANLLYPHKVIIYLEIIILEI